MNVAIRNVAGKLELVEIKATLEAHIIVEQMFSFYAPFIDGENYRQWRSKAMELGIAMPEPKERKDNEELFKLWADQITAIDFIRPYLKVDR